MRKAIPLAPAILSAQASRVNKAYHDYKNSI